MSHRTKVDLIGPAGGWLGQGNEDFDPQDAADDIASYSQESTIDGDNVKNDGQRPDDERFVRGYGRDRRLGRRGDSDTEGVQDGQEEGSKNGSKGIVRDRAGLQTSPDGERDEDHFGSVCRQDI